MAPSVAIADVPSNGVNGVDRHKSANGHNGSNASFHLKGRNGHSGGGIDGSFGLKKSQSEMPVSYDINLPYRPVTEANGHPTTTDKKKTKYPQYLPDFEPMYFPPCPLFEFQDPALRAEPSKPHLSSIPGLSIKDITPKMGSEVRGIQLSQLNSAQRDELALLVSERKAVVFRDQDFLDQGPQFQQDFAAHYGKPNYQPVTGNVPGFPGFHIIYRDGNQAELDRFFSERLTSTLWHHDVSYERQPPGYVLLCAMQVPDVGGDTVFASTTEAYNRLSPVFRKTLEPLRALHTSSKMIDFALKNGGLIRKDAVTSSHPIVRVHPVTGERALFLNGEFVTRIEGMKQAESDLLTKFLIEHITGGHDFQARVRWEPGSVVMFDNRSTIHTATVDYDATSVRDRHLFRLATMAEVPIAVTQSEP